MIEKDYQFETITPVIIRGVEKQEEFRIPSIKGVMRFWFRALMSSFIDDIKKLYEVESNIFGSTNEKSKVIIQIDQFNEKNFQDMNYDNYKYFLFPFRKKEYRVKWINNGVNFSLKCNIKDIDPQIIDATFKLISLFGGLGARSRRGFGSICLSDLKIDNIENFLKEFSLIIEIYKKFIKDNSINMNFNRNSREYSSFVNGEIIFLDNNKYQWKKFISEIYSKLSEELINPKTYEKIFLGELRNFKGADGLDEVIKFIELIWHYFRYKNKWNMAKINLGLPIGTSDFSYNYASERRASPIFFKILKLQSGKYLPIIFYLNSKNLLANERLEIQIIKNYFNVLNDKYNNKKPFNDFLFK